MKSKGQNVIEIVIIIALISVASILALTLLGGNIFNMFKSSQDKFEKFEPFTENKNNSGNIPVNTPVTSPVNVEYSYNTSGNLDITLDGMIISDIPSDFYNVLQATGSSGGTQTLADLITQLADQLIASGKAPEHEVEVLKNIASKARQMAELEKQIEELSKGVVNFCSTQPNAQDCKYNAYYEEGGRELVTQLAGDMGHGGLNGELKAYLKNDDFINFKENYPESSILVELLTDEIYNLALNIEINDRSLGDKGYFEDGKVRLFNAQDILTPGFEDPSKITDIDGKIICHIGKGSYETEGCN
jgi:Flp pilus assembly pilin Flp